jgi:uncharacterized protein YjbI with pentapeptide repeats
MANEEHLCFLREGAYSWKLFRNDFPDIRPDFAGVNFTNADISFSETLQGDIGEELFTANLENADLSGANLSGLDLFGVWFYLADLHSANLGGADLHYACLSGADLRNAKLNGANLSNADLSNADLRGAELRSANLTRTRLDGANLSEAHVGWTVFGNVNLSVAEGLESVIHEGPSTIGIDTIYASQGRIPEVFLRGAGVPDDFIAYISSFITGKAIQFYSCFISYSTKDQAFAERLHADLQAKRVRCWFAPVDVRGGRKLHEQIEQAIRHYDKLLLVLSEHSMSSEWVKTEIYHARQDEIRTQRRKLFPISLVDFPTIQSWTAFDADTGKDMGREVREYFVPDFSNWKNHDAYKVAFDRLLRDLRAEDRPAADRSNA